MMATSSTDETQRSFHLRRRNRPHPSAPPLDILEADDNHNEINSNYLPSMEPRPRLYPDLTQNLTEETQSTAVHERPPDVRERVTDTHFFDTDSGFYSTSATPSEEDLRNQQENTVNDVPDTFTETAQNDYNSEVERIMQVCYSSFVILFSPPSFLILEKNLSVSNITSGMRH